MRRAVLLCLGVVVFTWLGFRYFPGHTYLQSDTQIYLPILERLDSPGFLSRDPVATRPHVAYTIYDEVALSLHRVAHLDFKTALIGQQLLFRAGDLVGVYLIATAAGLPDVYAFLVAAFLNLGAALLGPAVLLVEYEPVPRGYAAALVLLALGLLAHERPLLAGLAASLAFLYHPPASAPFWGAALIAYACDGVLRRSWKPLLLTLFLSALLLANLAQLQPGMVEPQRIFGHLTPAAVALQKFRARYDWVSIWAARDIWHYAAICVCALWATQRIWPALNRTLRWFFVLLPVGGVLCVPLSYLLLEQWRWAVIPEFQPARSLVYTVAAAAIACGIAGVRAALANRTAEATGWFLVVFAMPIDVRVFDLLALGSAAHVARFAVWVLLAAGTAWLIRLARQGPTRWAAVAVPAVAVFAIPTLAHVRNYPQLDEAPITQVADWAKKKTWGSSMFLFPDAGHELYPGVFRAESLRALYVDWKSGGQVNYFESFGTEWYARFEATMEGAYSAKRLQGMLALPVDYYVLKREHRLAGVKPVYENGEFVVYDAEDLRNASTSLRSGTDG